VNVVIDGTGFSAVPFDNDVTVGGIPAAIVAESAIQITFTMPFLFQIGILTDAHVQVVVTNFTPATPESGRAWFRVQEDADEIADRVIASAIPGQFELVGTDSDRPRYFEAKDMEKLAALIETWTRDLDPGQILAADANPAVSEPGGTPGLGAALLVDLAEATNLRWSQEQDAMLPFGSDVPAAATLLVADGDLTLAAGAGGTEQWAPTAGTVNLIWLLVKSAGPTLDRVRLLVEGVSVFDSGAGLALGNNAVFSANPAAVVAQGDRVEIEATSAGGATQVVGGARLRS